MHSNNNIEFKQNAEVDSLAKELAEHLSLQENFQKKAVSFENFYKQIENLENKLELLKANSESEPEQRVALAKELLHQIESLVKRLTNQKNFIVNHISFSEFQGGTHPRLLALRLSAQAIINTMPGAEEKNSPLTDHKEAKIAIEHMIRPVQSFKIKKAYLDIYNGRKYKKSGLVQSNENPIKKLSQNNIKLIKQKLIDGLSVGEEKEAKPKNHFGLRVDEIDLFEVLLNLPFKLQHATNHFSDIARSGRLNSLTEIQRSDKSYVSPFSTKGNIKELGNGGFVFFRCYVDGSNGDQTRYGNSCIIADLSLLRSCGWVSLHDQLVPFSKKNRKQTVYSGKRIIFQAEPASIKNTAKAKKSGDAITYTYRTTPIASYSEGSKDVQKNFGKKINVNKETISFTEEVFYGGDILPGIALTFIYKLRQLEACGYRAVILSEFQKSTELERIILLGPLIKDFFRIEGKYPVSLQLQYNSSNQSCFFKPYGTSDRLRIQHDRALFIENPDGDGHLNLDLSVNSQNATLAFYQDKLKCVIDAIAVKQKHPNDKAAMKELAVLKKQKDELENKLKKAEEEREDFILAIEEVGHEDDMAWLKKRSYEFLEIINDHLLDYIEQKQLDIDNLKNTSLSRLSLLTQEIWLDLLEQESITWDDLWSLSDSELEEMPEEDLKFAINDCGRSFVDLLKFFREDRSKFEWLTCDDFNNLILEHPDKVSKELLDFIVEIGEEIDWDYIEYSLPASEWEDLQADLNSFYEEEEVSNNLYYDDGSLVEFETDCEELNSEAEVEVKEDAKDDLENFTASHSLKL